MKIAIVGAGVAGRALYRLLELEGFSDVDIYGIKHSTKCGISPCGWAVCTKEFHKVHNDLQLPVTTIINTFSNLQVGDMTVRCDLSTFDKPAFLRQMCHNSTIKNAGRRKSGEHDLIVDATGTARALLPPIKDDMQVICRQTRYRADKETKLSIFPSGSLGYSWIFPLNNGTVHIGSGFVKDKQASGSDEFEKMVDLAGVKGTRQVCSCKSEIRMLSPKHCEPIVHGKIVGIGEAVGTVSPLCGAGVVPAIESAKLLADNIGNEKRYAHLLINKFSYLDREVAILKKLSEGKRLGTVDVLTMRGNAARFGIFYGWRDAIKTIKMVGGRLL
jgi:flavin-dependent dehydrogenase